MQVKKAARGSCHYQRAKCSRRTRSIVSDKDQAMLAAGLLMAVSFGCMFLWAAVMW